MSGYLSRGETHMVAIVTPEIVIFTKVRNS